MSAAEIASEPPELEPTRDQSRSRRKRAIRANTISAKRTTKSELRMLRAQADADLEEAGQFFSPVTRGDCANVPRPCPFVSCQHHLYLDVSARTGAIKLNFPDLEVGNMTETCALDVADRGGMTLEQVSEAMNITRERVRQIEVEVYAKVRAELSALVDHEGQPDARMHLRVLAHLPEHYEIDDFDIGHEANSARVAACL